MQKFTTTINAVAPDTEGQLVVYPGPSVWAKDIESARAILDASGRKYCFIDEVESEEPLTLGEAAVRVTFCPPNLPKVAEIKQAFAELYDLLEGVKALDPRAVAIARTHIEEASFRAVYAATAAPEVKV